MNDYKNAAIGMKQLFTSEILQIISVVFLFITSVLAALGTAGNSMDTADSSVFSGILVAALIVGLIWSMFMLVAFILKLVGLSRAGRDHIYFKYAFALVFVGIMLTVGAGIFSTNQIVSGILGTLAECVDVALMILVVSGCISLLNEKGNLPMVVSGYSVINVMVLVNMISVVARVLPIFIVSDTTDIVFFGFYAILSIVSGIMYLVFLKKASKALA